MFAHQYRVLTGRGGVGRGTGVGEIVRGGNGVGSAGCLMRRHAYLQSCVIQMRWQTNRDGQTSFNVKTMRLELSMAR